MANQNCEMCGKYSASTSRLYRYDNGEQFNAGVCSKCADLHDRLVA